MNNLEKLRECGTDLNMLPGNLLCEWAADEIESLYKQNKRLEQWVDDCQKGMFINCVYCGNRYGPDNGNHLTNMREALHAHIEECPKHPMSKLKTELKNMQKQRDVALGLLAGDRIPDSLVKETLGEGILIEQKRKSLTKGE